MMHGQKGNSVLLPWKQSCPIVGKRKSISFPVPANGRKQHESNGFQTVISVSLQENQQSDYRGV